MKKYLSVLLALLFLSGCTFDATAIKKAALEWWEKQQTSDPAPEPVPVPTPIPDPTPTPEPVPNPGHEENIVVADMAAIPDRMRQAGFTGSDGALWYALAFVGAFGPGNMPDDGAGSLIELSRRSPEIEKWWDGEIAKVISQMRANPKATATAITNDARDRCGFRLGPTIVDRLKEFGDRVTLGITTPESEYQ